MPDPSPPALLVLALFAATVKRAPLSAPKALEELPEAVAGAFADATFVAVAVDGVGWAEALEGCRELTEMGEAAVGDPTGTAAPGGRTPPTLVPTLY